MAYETTDKIDPQELERQRAILASGMRPPTLDPNVSLPAAMAPPEMPAAGGGLAPVTLGRGPQPIDTSVAPVSPGLTGATLDPNARQDLAPHGWKKAGLMAASMLTNDFPAVHKMVDNSLNAPAVARAADVAAQAQQLGVQKEKLGMQDTQSQIDERTQRIEDAKNKPAPETSLAQMHANAVRDAMAKGVDPSKDPATQHYADAITSIQKEPNAPANTDKTVRIIDGVPHEILIDKKTGADIKDLGQTKLSGDQKPEPGSWSLQEGPDGKSVLLNSKTGEQKAAPPGMVPKGQHAKGETTVIGTDPSTGKQVQVSQDEADKKGLKDVNKANATEVGLTNSARAWLDLANKKGNPNDSSTMGILPLIDKLDKAGKLGSLASRWNEFMAGKFGSGDPDFEALRAKMGLGTTLLMKAHVGNRGGSYMLEHFEDLANAKRMDAATLKAGMKSELDYMTDKAMLPSGSGGGEMIRARDPQGKLHEAPSGTALPAGWKKE